MVCAGIGKAPFLPGTEASPMPAAAGPAYTELCMDTCDMSKLSFNCT